MVAAEKFVGDKHEEDAQERVEVDKDAHGSGKQEHQAEGGIQERDNGGGSGNRKDNVNHKDRQQGKVHFAEFFQ